jgi:hypothetical protein
MAWRSSRWPVFAARIIDAAANPRQACRVRDFKPILAKPVGAFERQTRRRIGR